MSDTSKPVYPRPPIGSVDVLAEVLGFPQPVLCRVSHDAHRYRVAGRKKKPDGTTRTLWEAREPLKTIQARITERILRVVVYPDHLQGALSGRDYVSDATVHSGRKSLICLDIKRFYPNCHESVIRAIWLHFFKFPPIVADLLTALTTRDGGLPQGASPSSYLANLVFFRNEADLVQELEGLNLRYTRFVDDISISSAGPIDNRTKGHVVKAVLGLVARKGFSLHRGKLQLSNRSGEMTVHKLNVKPRRPTLLGKHRNEIRAYIGSVERAARESREGPKYRSQFRRAKGLAALVKRFHKVQGQGLLDRLNAIPPRHSDADVAKLRRAVNRLCSKPQACRSETNARRALSRVRQEIGELKKSRPREAQRLKRQLSMHL